MSIWTELLFMHGHVASVETLATLAPGAKPASGAESTAPSMQTTPAPIHAIMGACTPSP
jgi:hypothetical protein